MTAGVQSLWPEDIRLDVLTPQQILRQQAPLLAASTKGLLEAEVREVDAVSSENVERKVFDLDIYVPALGNYTHRIMSIGHDAERPYPARVVSEFIATDDAGSPETAHSNAELSQVIGKVPNSPGLRSLLHSLIARINESGRLSSAD